MLAFAAPAQALPEKLAFSGVFEAGPLMGEDFFGTFTVDVDDRFAPSELTFSTLGFDLTATASPGATTAGNFHFFNIAFGTGERLNLDIIKGRIFSLSDDFLHGGASVTEVEFITSAGTSFCTPTGFPCPIGLAAYVPEDVPEPAAAGLLAAGLAALGWVGRRRRPADHSVA